MIFSAHDEDSMSPGAIRTYNFRLCGVSGAGDTTQVTWNLIRSRSQSSPLVYLSSIIPTLVRKDLKPI